VKIRLCLQGHDQVLRRWAFEYLNDAINRTGVDSDIIDLAVDSPNLLDSADCVVLFRMWEPWTVELAQKLHDAGKYIVYFIDDFIWDGRLWPAEWGVGILKHMEIADALMSSSNFLLTKMPAKPKILRRSCLDRESMAILGAEHYHNKHIANVGILSGMGRSKHMDLFVADLYNQVDKHVTHTDVRRIQFTYFSHACTFQHFSCIDVFPTAYFKAEDWRQLYQKWNQLDFSMAINILNEGDEFCRCKSELKLVESGAMGIPLITSRVQPYIELIKEGENGFFASTPQEFTEKILYLMRNPVVAKRVGENAHQFVQQYYNVDDNAREFLNTLATAMGNRVVTVPKPKPKLASKIRAWWSRK